MRSTRSTPWRNLAGGARPPIRAPGSAFPPSGSTFSRSAEAVPRRPSSSAVTRIERTQLDLFRSVPANPAPRDAQDLMSWPFFSLAKSRRIAPIDFRMGETRISVEDVPEHGLATIWDADILIWAASQLVEARDAGRPTSRLMATTPPAKLTYIRPGTGRANNDRLKAALDRLQSTTVATSIHQQHPPRRHRFPWLHTGQEQPPPHK